MAKNKNTRIMAFGTFDVLHKGHLNFFKQARKLSANPFLIVSVARDINVKKIKGKLPINDEKKRLSFIKSSNLVNKAVLGGLREHLPHILKEKPDVIALGYDQTVYTAGLKKYLTKKSLNVNIIRLKAYRPSLYKSSKLNDNRH